MHYRFQSFLYENACFRTILKTQTSSTKLDHHDYHPHYEIYYCRNHVEQDIIINGQSLTLNSPCIILSAPFSIHGMSLHNASNTEFERFTIYFNDTFLESFGENMLPNSFFHKYPNCIYPLTDEQNQITSFLFERLLDAADAYAESCAYFAAIVNGITRMVPPESRITKGSTSYYVVNVLKYIYENKASPVNADLLSEQFHVSRAKLDRDFRRFVGQSIHKTVIDCRLNYATELLQTSKMQIREIAALCGFESEYYFYAFFKRNTGKTPTEVRRSQSIVKM